MDKKQKNSQNSMPLLGGGKTYKEKIIEMVEQIENERYIRMIYGYVRSAYREEKGRD